jgi:hypothetical protein
MSTGADDLSEYVMVLVAEELGRSRKAMLPGSRIEEDFGCTGDDARQLLERMQREFEIDMADFVFERHFGDETAGWPVLVTLVVTLPVAVLAMQGIGFACRIAQCGGDSVRQSGWFFFAVCTVCALLIAYLTRYLPSASREPKISVTVQDLIDAARTRRWPYAGSERRRV